MNAKLEKAIAWMGTRYVMHPSRRVQKLSKGDQVEMHTTDIAETFKRVVKQIEEEKAKRLRDERRAAKKGEQQ